MKTSKEFQVLFIQGGGEDGCQADQSMVASLKDSLGKHYQLHYPELRSDGSAPDYGWTKQIAGLLSGIHDPLILVGHFFGASMILKYLTQYKLSRIIEGIFLVATPFWSGEEDWVQGFKLRAILQGIWTMRFQCIFIIAPMMGWFLSHICTTIENTFPMQAFVL